MLQFATACSDETEAAGNKDGSACDCSKSGLFTCVDTKSIKTCDGCSWKKHTCDELCKINKGSGWEMDPQLGCKADSKTGDGICNCKMKPTKTMCTLTWTITDTCDDSKSPKVTFYDLEQKKSIGSHTLPQYNKALKTPISCKCGNKICYGATQGTTYWGCGESCQKPCTNCCAPCTDGATTTSLNC